MSLAGYITKDEVIKIDGSCGGAYNFVICSGLDINEGYRITGSGCTWEESHGDVAQKFNNQFGSYPTGSNLSGVGQFGYTYCSLGEVSGVSWPCPSGFILEGVVSREDCECEGPDCTDVSGCIEAGDGGCYSIEAYLDWDKPDWSVDNTVLLIQSDTTDEDDDIVDSSPSNHSVTTVGHPHHETDESKFGSSSIHFGGSGSGHAVDSVVLFIESDTTGDNVVLFIESDTTDETDGVIDSSPSNHSITRVGDAHHETDQKKFGSSSIYLDGSGDHLSVGDSGSSDWDFGDEDWTMEAWVRPTISYSVIIGKWLTTGGSDNSFVISTDINNKVKGFFQNDCTATDHGVVLQGTIALTLDDSFYHVAVKRIGDSIQLYIDGVFDTSVAFTGSLCTSTQSLQIGDFGNWDNSIQSPKEYQGYIDNVKITRVSSGSTDIVDSSPSNHSITTVGDTHHATAQKKFGSSSVYFDGAGDHLSVGDADSPDWDFGDEDWTMEMWARPTIEHSALMGKWLTTHGSGFQTGANSFIFWVEQNTRKIKGFFQNDCIATGAGVILQGSIALTLDDRFYHVAVKRVGDSIQLYIDGVFDTSVAFTGSLCTSTQSLQIGDFGNWANFEQSPKEYRGYIDNVKITKADSAESSSAGHLSVADDDEFDFGTGPFTIETWLYVNNLPSTYGVPIISKGDQGAEGEASFQISIAGPTDQSGEGNLNQGSHALGKVLVARLYDNNVSNLYSNTVLSEDTWHHVKVVREGTGINQMKLYVDGTLDTSWTKSNSTHANSHSLLIGAMRDNGVAPAVATEGFDGYLDEIKITTGVAGTCEDLCDPYDPTGCPPDMDLYVKVGSGCKDAGGSTVYYNNMAVEGDNMLSGKWYEGLNQDSNPECACEPMGAEYITGGVYDEDRDFYAWFSQYSDCANDLVTGLTSEGYPAHPWNDWGGKIRSYFKVINHCAKNLTVYVHDSGQDTVVVVNCPPYGEFVTSGLAHAGYNTGPIPNFANNYVHSQVKLNPTMISVRDTHDELTYPECADECQTSGTTEDKYRATYDFNSGVVNKTWEVNCDNVNQFSAYAETDIYLDVGSFSIEECACACPPGIEACTWYPPETAADGEIYGGFWACPDWYSTCVSGQNCCGLSPVNKGSISLTFGATQTGVTVDVPYVFYGTGVYTGQCVSYIENQKTKECWTASNSAHAPSNYYCDSACTGVNPPQDSIAYGGAAKVFFNEMQSAATIDCTGWTDNVEIPRDCCNVAVIDTYPSGHPAHTLGGERPGGTGYSPSGDYLSLLDMQVGQTITPIYEAFVTGCLLRSGDNNGEYLMSFPDNRTFTLNHTGTNVCEDQGDFGNIIGKVYTLTLNSTGAPTQWE